MEIGLLNAIGNEWSGIVEQVNFDGLLNDKETEIFLFATADSSHVSEEKFFEITSQHFMKLISHQIVGATTHQHVRHSKRECHRMAKAMDGCHTMGIVLKLNKGVPTHIDVEVE